MSARTPVALVVGSVHMDLVARAERHPASGESVTGSSFELSPGGKAGYQAAQLARAGVETHLLSRVGRDAFGRQILQALAAAGVNTRFVGTDLTRPTGVSTVFESAGDYSSIIVPGAAASVDEDQIACAIRALSGLDALVVQLELPIETSLRAARIASLAGVRVIANVSPAPDEISPQVAELLHAASIVVVNRIEAGRLGHRQIEFDLDASAVATDIAGRFGLEWVVVTMGPRGAIAAAPTESLVQPALAVNVVNSVGAGDAFLGAMLGSLLSGSSMPVAMERAVAAGTVAVGRYTRIQSMPEPDEINSIIVQA